MGIAPKEIHTLGSIKQLKTGASTGVSPKAFKNMIQFAEDEIEERTGKRIKIPVDKEGADILLIHNSGEFITWPENPEAFAILFETAGLNWTLSSEIGGYEGTNYGTWYDDVQFSRIALRQLEVARRMKVKKIVVGECGHAHKAMVVVADRLLTGDARVPRESFLPLLEEIVSSGKLNLDPQRNNFPVTLQDPCNVVRLMGIVEPQRKILRQIAPQFREMNPHGVDNYCCGGGSGFGIIDSTNFAEWRVNVAGRMKVKQILEAFANEKAETKKYICAPCSNCKGQIRNLIDHFALKEKYGLHYGGLVELVVNAMKDIKGPFIKFE
jgi:Fe-S oxidoreductase